jgi:hypothetical protein
VLLLSRHPARLAARHPRLIEDLLELAAEGQQEAVNAMIEMLADFHQHGLDSRFPKKLKGYPVWELKTRTRGGMKGGARIYFFFAGKSTAIMVNAESKEGDAPDARKLSEAIEIFGAYRQGIPVIKEES